MAACWSPSCWRCLRPYTRDSYSILSMTNKGRCRKACRRWRASRSSLSSLAGLASAVVASGEGILSRRSRRNPRGPENDSCPLSLAPSAVRPGNLDGNDVGDSGKPCAGRNGCLRHLLHRGAGDIHAALFVIVVVIVALVVVVSLSVRRRSHHSRQRCLEPRQADPCSRACRNAGALPPGPCPVLPGYRPVR